MRELYNKTSPEIEAEIVAKYKEGLGVVELSEKYDKHRSTIQAILIRNKIKLRLKSNKYHHNKDFFARYTPASCYWAGFILADGYIRYNHDSLHIKLHVKDRIHLEKFKASIDFDGTVRAYPKDEYCCIDINCSKLVNDLKNNFGITPRKSNTAKFKSNIPSDMYDHFIRGIMDGDGCIGFNKTKYGRYIHLSIVGTKYLMTSIRNIITSKLNIDPPPLQVGIKKYESVFRSLHYQSLKAETILNWLYARSTSELRLDRKYDLWINKPNVKHLPPRNLVEIKNRKDGIVKELKLGNKGVDIAKKYGVSKGFVSHFKVGIANEKF